MKINYQLPKSKCIATKIENYLSIHRFTTTLVEHLGYSHLYFKKHICGQFLIKKGNELAFQFYEHKSIA